MTTENSKYLKQPHFEIERKFLVKSLPGNLEQYSHQNIIQGYIAITENGTEVRLREKGEKYFLTVKTGHQQSRVEHEIEISSGQFSLLWPATETRTVEKTRYKIPHGNAVIELDIYKGKLEGLCTAEIEFHSEEDSNAYMQPDWFGLEVTMAPQYKNKNLALNGLPDR